MVRRPVGQGAFERVQVLDIGHGVVERDVEVACLFAEGEIASPVHGERKHAWIAAEDRRSSVTLMYVTVHHHHPLGSLLALVHANRHRDIIEDAIALTTIGKRVVRATSEVHPYAIVKRCCARGDRRADGPTRPLDELW